MSYRPYIAVRVDGCIPYACYCRNWSCRGLLLETVRIAAGYSDCRTPEAFCERKYGAVAQEELDERMSFYETVFDDAEDLFIVDLTLGMIYDADAAGEAGEPENLPDLLGQSGGDLCPGGEEARKAGSVLLETLLRKVLSDDGEGSREEEYELEHACSKILHGSRIPFEYIDAGVRELFAEG